MNARLYTVKRAGRVDVKLIVLAENVQYNDVDIDPWTDAFNRELDKAIESGAFFYMGEDELFVTHEEF